MIERNAFQRIEKWDIAKAVLIFLVVLGHITNHCIEYSENMRALHLFIYSFHMPCFIFISGMFSKRDINEKRYLRIFAFVVLYVVIKVLIALVKGIINHSISFSLFTEGGQHGIALLYSGAVW